MKWQRQPAAIPATPWERRSSSAGRRTCLTAVPATTSRVCSTISPRRAWVRRIWNSWSSHRRWNPFEEKRCGSWPRLEVRRQSNEASCSGRAPKVGAGLVRRMDQTMAWSRPRGAGVRPRARHDGPGRGDAPPRISTWTSWTPAARRGFSAARRTYSAQLRRPVCEAAGSLSCTSSQRAEFGWSARCAPRSACTQSIRSILGGR
mmetsp:Transcript_58414/g.169148  ORF Transcript_58414/g.169148 Transcript_58414/m.169148 type:complete len:204 (-) Transcript_58414:16-627(-)